MKVRYERSTSSTTGWRAALARFRWRFASASTWRPAPPTREQILGAIAGAIAASMLSLGLVGCATPRPEDPAVYRPRAPVSYPIPN